MKKTLAILMAVLMLFALCACGSKDVEEGGDDVISGMPNPVTEADNLEEINELTGGKLCAPGVMGVEDKSFSTIDCGDYKVAQYVFTVNGNEFTFRYAPVKDVDISGVYEGETSAFEGKDAGEVEYAEADTVKLARWADGEGQYVLSMAAGEETDAETFSTMAEELMSIIAQ